MRGHWATDIVVSLVLIGVNFKTPSKLNLVRFVLLWDVPRLLTILFLLLMILPMLVVPVVVVLVVDGCGGGGGGDAVKRTFVCSRL